MSSRRRFAMAGAVSVLVSLWAMAGLVLRRGEGDPLADRLCGGQGESQGREEAAAGRFHRLGLVRLVQEAQRGGVRQGRVQDRGPQAVCAGGTGFPAQEEAVRGAAEAEP